MCALASRGRTRRHTRKAARATFRLPVSLCFVTPLRMKSTLKACLCGTGTGRSVPMSEEEDRWSGYSSEATPQRPPSAALPDRMFYSPPSSLSCVANAWWGHFKYIIVTATVITLTMYSIIIAMKNKCAQGLTRDVFELHGQSEVNTNFVYFLFSGGLHARSHLRSPQHVPIFDYLPRHGTI